MGSSSLSKKFKLRVLTGFDAEVEVVYEQSFYCSPGVVYFLEESTPRGFLKTLKSVERERDRAIARYDNVLKGLKYWRERALTEKPATPKLEG